MFEWLVLTAAAFCAGVLNSIAGGGSFLTFPALVFAGIPPVAANATSAVAVFPGYLGAVAGFRRELMCLGRHLFFRYLCISLLGGFCGSLLLLITSNTVFSVIVPWLLLFATVLFACGEWLLQSLRKYSPSFRFPDTILLFAISLYGGYFNGGLGIILLAALLFIGHTDLNQMNGLKNGISFCVSIISVATFAVAGLVRWPEAFVMMIGASAGGYFGAVVARKIPARSLKYAITAVGAVMSCIFFVRM